MSYTLPIPRLLPRFTPFLKIKNSNFFIFLVIVAYLIVAFNSSGYHHEDEHYQIIEFANYKLGAIGLEKLAWEFKEQIRPGLQPSICYVLFTILKSIGITDVYILAFILRAISALLSVVVISLFVNAHISYVSEKLKSWFIFLSYFLWFLPYINVRFSSESWSGLMLLLSLVYIQKFRNRSNLKNLIFIGAFLGLSVLFRYQAMLCVFGLGLWFVIIHKATLIHSMQIFLAFSTTLILGIFIDYWLYGNVTLTLYNYFQVNIINNVASSFGVSPWPTYIFFILKSPGPIGIFILSSIFILIWLNPKSVFIWTAIPFLIVHSIIPHKELRFLFPLANLTPIFLILAFQELWIHYKTKYTLAVVLTSWIIGTIFVIVNIHGLLAISLIGAGSRKVSVTDYIHSHYKQKSVNIIIPEGTEIFVDWNPPFNTFYSSKGWHIQKISSVWQDDILTFKQKDIRNILVTYDDQQDNASIKRLKELKMFEVYQNFPKFLVPILSIYDPKLKNSIIKIYEFR